MKQAFRQWCGGWLPLLFCALTATAQVPARQVPQDIQARWINLTEFDWGRGKNGRQMNFEYTIGTTDEIHNAGFFGQRLRRDMQRLGNLAPEAEQALNRYRRQKWLFLTERVTFVTTLTIAGADLVTTESELFPHSPYIMSGVALTSLLANIFISRNTNSHMQRAVKAYQGALFPQTPRGALDRLRPSFGTIAPMRGGVGVVVGWQW